MVVNQQQGGGDWQLLGSYAFPAGTATVSLSDDANGYVIADAVKLVADGAAPNTATWTPALTAPGAYRVYARWTAHPNRASNATYTVHHAGGATPVTVNQQQSTGEWVLLGSFDFIPGHRVALTDQADGVVIADAVKWVPVDAAPNSATWPLAVAQSGEHAVYARWTAHANRATDAPYTIHHADGSATVSVNQQQGGGDWQLLGTYHFNAGGDHSIQLTDQADGYVIADAVKLVATGQTGGSAGGVFYVHTDHLGTPKVITDENQQVAWQADYAPFGEATVTTASIENPLRLPGQYFDQETGLHYNYFRDYDPSIGRYVQSDPIGLIGGVNTYAYVGGNPIIRIDPFGLAWRCTCRASEKGGVPLPDYSAKRCTYTCKCNCEDDLFPFFKKTVVVTTETRRFSTDPWDRGNLICHGQGYDPSTRTPTFSEFGVTSSYRDSYPDVYDAINSRLDCNDGKCPTKK
ncbi:MAG: RHS repeat-associated core domain-containing protein [Gammaproteobacteria bacterium]|nr:RHS repeat-associated core domain-containing protein [Gammaproteobacteria bacterium]